MQGQGTIDTSDKPVRALGLCSGGLDSMISALVLRKQGIEVQWVTFETPFFSAEKARKASRITGVPLTVQNITAEYLEMLKNPPAGYGKQMKRPGVTEHRVHFGRNVSRLPYQVTPREGCRPRRKVTINYTDNPRSYPVDKRQIAY